MPDVSVVVVTYEGRELLRRCLSALAGDEPHEATRELIVVDQASTDGTAEWLRAEHPEARLVRLELNVGFGAGNNRGAAAADGRWLLLLNSDCFVDPGAIDELVRFGDARPQTGIVAPRLRFTDGRLQRSCRRFPSPYRIATEYLYLRKLAPGSAVLNGFYCGDFAHDAPRRVDWLTGACLLVRRELYERLGGFDESFFMYSEEVDLCRRALDLGFETWFDPAAGATHVWGGTTKRDPGPALRENVRSQLRYLDRHEGRASAEAARGVMLAGLALRAPRSRSHRAAAGWLARHTVGGLLRGNE